MDANKELKTICSESFRLLSDDFLLKEVKEKIRTALPNDEEGVDKLAEWWSIVSKVEQKAFVHLLVGDVVQGENGRVLNLTQRWTPFGNGAPITMMAAVGGGRVPGRGWKRTCFSGADRYGCMSVLLMRS